MSKTLENIVLEWVDTWIDEFVESGYTWETFKRKKFDYSFKESVNDVHRCPYLFKRGKRIGETCNVRVKGDDEFCAKHKSSCAVPKTELVIDLKKVMNESDDEIYSSSESNVSNADELDDDIDEVEEELDELDDDDDDE